METCEREKVERGNSMYREEGEGEGVVGIIDEVG